MNQHQESHQRETIHDIYDEFANFEEKKNGKAKIANRMSKICEQCIIHVYVLLYYVYVCMQESGIGAEGIFTSFPL